jgi:hypothetical protein
MVNRAELERLIVLGLGQLRLAEMDLENRLKKRPRSRGGWPAFVDSVKDLKAQAERVEALLGVLEQNDPHTPVAA